VRRLLGNRSWALYAAGFAAAWTSVVVAALGTALELAFSGTSPANIAVPAMGAVHALIGIGEGLITVGALAFLHASRVDLIKTDHVQPKYGRLVWAAGLLLAVLLAIASPLASRHPDGLMRVASQYGFINQAKNPLFSIIPHYAVPGIANKNLATVIAALIGILIVFAVTLGVAYSRRRKSSASTNPNDPTTS
jgi:cobalt/nickel transport system permease protein